MALYTFRWSTSDADGASVVVRNAAGDVVSSGSIVDTVAVTNEAFVSYSADLPVGDVYTATATVDGRSRSSVGVLDVEGTVSTLSDTFAPSKALRLGIYQGRPSLGDAFVSMTTPPTVAITGPSATGPITGTTLAHDTSMVSRREGRYSNQTINSNTYQNNYVNNPSTSRSQAVVEFTFYGSEFAAKFYNAIAGTSGLRILVDGQVAGQWATSGVSTQGQPYWATVTFSAVSVRRIRLEYVGGAIIGGFNFTATSSITPIPDRLPRCVVLGDSWIGGALNVTAENLYYYQLGRELGWETAKLGHGGSGYAQDGSGAGVNYEDPARVAELITYSPDYAVIFGSINNDATAPAAVQAAAADLYAQIAAGSSHTRVIVVGPQSIGTNTPAARYVVRDAVQAAAEAAPNVVAFIDPLAEAWITGTGREGATTGDGNADTWIGTDGSHPTIVGHKGYANLTAKAILRVA